MTTSKKTMNLIFASLLLAGGVALAIIYDGNNFAAGFTMCFAGCWMLGTLLTKNKTESKKDEMTKKAGYTALALTTKLYSFILGFVFIFDSFLHFINTVSASDVLFCSLYFILFSSWGSYAYYLRHPEKTGL